MKRPKDYLHKGESIDKYISLIPGERMINGDEMYVDGCWVKVANVQGSSVGSMYKVRRKKK